MSSGLVAFTQCTIASTPGILAYGMRAGRRSRGIDDAILKGSIAVPLTNNVCRTWSSGAVKEQPLEQFSLTRDERLIHRVLIAKVLKGPHVQFPDEQLYGGFGYVTWFEDRMPL